MDKIGKFYIIGVKMQGFKCFKEEYSANLDMLTYIAGANGQGKTSIAEAAAFAFCGTGFYGERSCDKLLNFNSQQMRVEIEIVDGNGEIHSLIRTRKGSETSISLDGIPLRQADMNTVFAEKDIFLSMFNPLYFIEKIAEDGREFLEKLLPVLKQEDIVSNLPDSTKAVLENQSLIDPECFIKNRRGELKELNENDTYLSGQKDLLNSQREEAVGKIDSVLAGINKIVERKNALEKKRGAGIDVNALKERLKQLCENPIDKRLAELSAKRAEIENRQYLSKYTQSMEKAKAELEMLMKSYNRLGAQLKNVKIGDICPTCHTAVTESNYQNIADGIKRELAEVYKNGSDAKAAYKEIAELDRQSRVKFEEFKKQDIDKINAEIKTLETGADEAKMLQNKLRFGNLTQAEFDELCNLEKQLQAYSVQVNALAETDKIPDKISEIEEIIKRNAQKKQELNRLISAAEEYTAKRAELMLGSLKMNRAAIKLYNVVKTTGEIKNVFKFTYNGRDYRSLSASEKIRAGLEVSGLLQRITGLCFPVYIDNAECITERLDPVRGQVIMAYARNCPLTVHLPNRQHGREAA